MRRIILLLMILLACGAPFEAIGQAGRISADSAAQLQRRKLQLEVEELEDRDPLSRAFGDAAWTRWIGVLNEPLVSTLLTLGIGGFLFSLLADRRARRGKNLEKAVETVDAMGKDLNHVLTALFLYIRSGNYTGSGGGDPGVAANRAAASEKLHGYVSDLYAKRFAILVQTKAFVPTRPSWWPGARRPAITKRYRLLVRNIESLLQLTDRAYNDPQWETSESDVRKKIEELEAAWPLKWTVPKRALKPRFGVLNEWGEQIWARAAALLSSTLSYILR